MKDLRLILPDLMHMDSYLDMCRELKARKVTAYTMWDDPDKVITMDHRRTLVQHYKDMSAGVNLPDGWVPATSMWLLDGDEVVGSVNIRHFLSDALRLYAGNIGYGIRPSMWRRGYGKAQLALALIEAKKLGIDRVLISCDEDNIGSRKIIEANGGAFDCMVEGDEADPSRKRRYWIENG